MQLELWMIDGELRLTYWDSMHGKDRFFILNPDGTAIESKLVGPEFTDERTPINLYEALRAMVEGAAE